MVKLVLSKIIRFFYRLLSKIIYLCIPFISRILIATRFHSRIINQLNKLRSESHKIDDHRNFISKFLGENKLVALDVGAQGGFFNASIFSEKYNKFFAPIMVEPIVSEAEKLVKQNYKDETHWGVDINAEIKMGDITLPKKERWLYQCLSEKELGWVNYEIQQRD